MCGLQSEKEKKKKGFVGSALSVSCTSPELLSGQRGGQGLSPPWVSWGWQQELW